MTGKKKPQKKIKKEAIPQVFLVLGFIGAALAQEFVNIVHDGAKSAGEIPYFLYSIFIYIAFAAFIYLMLKLIEYVYEER